MGLALTSGKVTLASNATQVTGPTVSNILDFVGYGLASQYECAGAAPSPSINSITRISGDTNNNNVDFTVTLPSPRAGTLAVSNIANNAFHSGFIKNTFVKSMKLFLEQM